MVHRQNARNQHNQTASLCDQCPRVDSRGCVTEERTLRNGGLALLINQYL